MSVNWTLFWKKHGDESTEKELKDLTQSLQTDGEQQMVNRVEMAQWLKAQTLEPD